MRRIDMPREFFVPKGAVKVSDRNSDAVAYLYERNGRLGAMTFVGKSNKPLTHFTYRDAARREAAIKEVFANRKAAMERKAERHAERTSFVHDYKVGDIFRTSWGYEQTNVEWFEITEVKGKHVILRELKADIESTGWERGNTKPMPGHYAEPRYAGDERGQPIRRLAQKGRIKIDDVRTAWPVKPNAKGEFESVSWTSYH